MSRSLWFVEDSELRADGADSDDIVIEDPVVRGTTSAVNDSMTADPETATEDGFITVTVGGISFQIPLYNA